MRQVGGRVNGCAQCRRSRESHYTEPAAEPHLSCMGRSSGGGSLAKWRVRWHRSWAVSGGRAADPFSCCGAAAGPAAAGGGPCGLASALAVVCCCCSGGLCCCRDASAFASNKARASRSHSSSPSSSQDILAATLPERFYIAYLATTRLVVVKRGQRTFNRGLGATSTPVKCPAGAIGRRR